MAHEDACPRKSTWRRESRETSIELDILLDGHGENNINTGYGMLDHMLDLLAFWGGMNLSISCSGDLHIDAHHTVEDIGIILGTALREASNEYTGIERVGFGRVPMDEALAEVSIDLSGRPWLVWRGDELLPPVIAREEKDIWREFFKALASSARMNMHVSFLYGKNGHHLLESAFKGSGMALRQATSRHGQNVRSTKGRIDK